MTNADFRAFVDATGYRTVAEIAPDPRDYPGMDPALAVPGSLVFTMTDTIVPLHDPSQWWSFVPGADWRHPLGPDSDIAALADHPVVQVGLCGCRSLCPVDGQIAADRGRVGICRAGWPDRCRVRLGRRIGTPGRGAGKLLGRAVPGRDDERPTGAYRTTPVRSFAANGFGLHDMIGNVWEWTRDWYSDRPSKAPTGCCEATNPRGAPIGGSYEPGSPRIGRKVLKGGSHLCAPNYCQRYRPAARHPQSIESSTSHIGFRCVSRRA